MQFKEWLNRPYPLIHTLRAKIILILGFGIFITVFLALYQPFGTDKIQEHKLLFLCGFGASTVLGLTTTYLLIPAIFSEIFDPEKWTIRKEILYILLSFLVISVLNYIYNATVGAEIAPPRTLLEFVGITLAVGMFPVVVMIFLVEIFLKKGNETRAQQLSAHLTRTQWERPPEILFIQPETARSAPLEIVENDFLFATSDNNYTTIFYLNGQSVEQELMRLSLKNLEQQVEHVEALFRCHRSYLVNKSRIRKFRGNARSLFLELEGYESPIPVSRKYSKEHLAS